VPRARHDREHRLGQQVRETPPVHRRRDPVLRTHHDHRFGPAQGREHRGILADEQLVGVPGHRLDRRRLDPLGDEPDVVALRPRPGAGAPGLGAGTAGGEAGMGHAARGGCRHMGLRDRAGPGAGRAVSGRAVPGEALGSVRVAGEGQRNDRGEPAGPLCGRLRTRGGPPARGQRRVEHEAPAGRAQQRRADDPVAEQLGTPGGERHDRDAAHRVPGHHHRHLWRHRALDHRGEVVAEPRHGERALRARRGSAVAALVVADEGGRARERPALEPPRLAVEHPAVREHHREPGRGALVHVGG
jgi:hypothetical protein